MYKQHASPFVRIVQGMPVSWEPTTATAYIDETPWAFAWSPCNRFIALVTNKSVEVRDAVTLSSLGTFGYLGHLRGPPCFSPDSRRLMQFDDRGLISWDLQTGAPHGVISGGSPALFSFTHSNDGKVIAVAYKHIHLDSYNPIPSSSFSTYDLHSWTHVDSCHSPEGEIIYPIWTHNEHFRFATVNPDSIQIWQTPFTLKHPPVEVESLPIPDEISNAGDFLFLPALSRLAFVLNNSIQIWDAKSSKLLLKSEFKQAFSPNIATPPHSSFSSDGRFFASANTTSEVHVWKESPTGYVCHQQLPFLTHLSQPQISPNGESIIVTLPSMLHQWHTRDQVLSLPSISTRHTAQHPFTLGFSPDKKFAVFVRRKEKMVTIVDLQSGEQRWTTNMGVKINCLGMTGDTIIVVGERVVATWNIPGGDSTFHTSINNKPQFTILKGSLGTPTNMSISLDLSHIVVARQSQTIWGSGSLDVHNVSTGGHLVRIKTTCTMTRLFTQDGHEVWAGSDGPFGEQSKIIKDSESGTIELSAQTTEGPPRVIFQESPCGHKVTDSGWVLSPTQRRLLWLPHHWRSRGVDRKWGGRFLGLLHHELLEVVILEFLE